MKQANETEYGPLGALIGVWTGDKGMDIAPEPDGPDENPFYETIEFTAVGGIDNADEQDLAAVWYRQIVRKQSDDRIFHDENWLLDVGPIRQYDYAFPHDPKRCVCARGWDICWAA